MQATTNGTTKRSGALFLSSAAAFFLVSQLSFAQMPPTEQESTNDKSRNNPTWAEYDFQRVDRNNDAVIEWSEINSRNSELIADVNWGEDYILSQFDQNKDGVLQENEYLVFVSHLIDKNMEQSSEQNVSVQPMSQQGERAAAESGNLTPSPDPANELAAESVDGSLVPGSITREQSESSAVSGVGVMVTAVEGGLRYVPLQAITDSEVVNLNGTKIGSVEDIVTSGGGDVAGLVVESGGFFSLGATELFVPIDAFYVVGEVLVWETMLRPEALRENEDFKYDSEEYTTLLNDQEGLLGGL